MKNHTERKPLFLNIILQNIYRDFLQIRLNIRLRSNVVDMKIIVTIFLTSILLQNLI